ncbi:MAG: cysteine desulfurase [Candidatus Magasanikbacteria bacterium]|jgi:cysteine desulfurase|nr:cysteine desulfurase [Candidatus Magasanikbacteria bacterium]MBT4221347.1 cysteine desulfurase [Candidatus Magasanikbacteria bacterium]MBT4350805.1 cysteine desulfurase [Candidatus Magasanikbacteria bacterium]MBT4541519.1 cysteine desulfurase [Candidatus Magasanikbacteria bacterium]MBT6253471.1 cysteine desulfurase [Candidatus Magasanikbacteria bacterium]
MVFRHFFKKSSIYLDHAAGTPVASFVFEKMKPYFTEHFGNPSSLYRLGTEAKKALQESRVRISTYLKTQSDTIIFTGSGTLSCNMAILGIAKKHQEQGKHIITTSVEHKAVLEAMKVLEARGFSVTYLPVDEYGNVTVKQVVDALQDDTILISCMFANNEIGTVYPIAEIGRALLQWRKKKKTVYPYFHSDACQASPYYDLSVEPLHVDLLTLNGSKMYGPKGVGILYCRRGVTLSPLIVGGGQEQGMFAGTENVPAIVGASYAFDAVQSLRKESYIEVKALRDYFWECLIDAVPDIRLTGPSLLEKNRLPHNIHVQFLGIEAETLVLYLDEYGIVCGTGSACTSESTDVSHVLHACGVSSNDAASSIRFTLGKDTTKKDIDYVMKVLPSVVKTLRSTQKFSH